MTRGCLCVGRYVFAIADSFLLSLPDRKRAGYLRSGVVSLGLGETES